MLPCTETMDRDTEQLVVVTVPRDGGAFGPRAMAESKDANVFASDVREMATTYLLDRREDVIPALVALLVEYGYVAGATKEVVAGSLIASWMEYAGDARDTVPAPPHLGPSE